MSTIRATAENLIEALACDHQSRTKHDFRKPDEYRQHCMTCFYLKMALEGISGLPGDDDVVIVRKDKKKDDTL